MTGAARLQIVAQVPGDGCRESVTDKHTQPRRASNPFVPGYDGGEFASVQLTKVRDPEFVPSDSRSVAVEQYTCKRTDIAVVT